MTLPLKHEIVAPPGGQPLRSLLFLHGILGSGANLRTLAKRFVAQRPEWQGVLVDLRAHGGSLGHDGPDTVQAAAGDVAALGAALTVPLRGAVAHSFGGKVALQLVGAASLEHVALIDSTPGARFDHRGSEFTMHVLELLDTLEGRTWASRDEFVRTLMANGQARDIALWLAMNLISESGRVRFALELPRIHALLASYFSLDAWAVLEQNSGPQFHIVLGERSGVYDDQDKARLAALQATSNGRISVDTLPAGHWVHVDDFEGLLRVLVNRIAPQQP